MARRRKQKAEPVAPEPVEAEVVEAEKCDPYDADYIKSLLETVPPSIFRHSVKFTPEEDLIIAAGLKTRSPIYRIADMLRCNRTTLSNHIKATPALAEIALAAREQEREEVQEAVDDCINRRVPAVVMWAAEKLLPEKYGQERRVESDEDETRIVIGALPDDMLAEGDAILAEAASKPPDVGLSALADPRVLSAPATIEESPLDVARRVEMVNAGAEVSPLPLDQTLPAPALKPGGDPRFAPYVEAEPPAAPEPAPPKAASADEEPDAPEDDLDDASFDDDFSGGWLS